MFLTLVYTFYMGFNDGANAVASTIATRAMKPRVAIVVAAITKLITSMLLYLIINNLAVAKTIHKFIKGDVLVIADSGIAYCFLLAGLLSTLIWSFFTYYRKMPNSSSHTLMGGLVGAGIAAFGFFNIDWNLIVFRVLLMAILAPMLGLGIGYVFMKLFRKMSRSAPRTINGVLMNFQKVNVIILASSLSMNNVQKALGVLFLVMTIGNITSFTGSPHDLLIMLVICGSMLTIGMMFGGYRIINTVGNKIFKLQPYHSVVAQVSTGAIIYASSALGVPVSTGQVVSSTIMGVGASERLSGVQWLTAKRIFISWFVTFPISATLGAVLYYLITMIKGVI